MRFIIYSFLILLCFSCSSRPNIERIECYETSELHSVDIIYEFDDKYPVSLAKRDSLLFVIQIKSDTCLSVINLNNRKELCSFGTVGHGDVDLLNPNFIQSIDDGSLLLDVGNLRKIVDIEYIDSDSIKMTNLDYPDSIFISSELNMSDNYIVGRKVDAYDKDMFFIYDKNRNVKKSVTCYPLYHSFIKDFNYTYASVLALNETKGRIVSGMYFFDIFHVYDLAGNRLMTFKFSDDCYPSIDRKSGRIDFSKGYNGIVRSYSTQGYCYLLRMMNKDLNELPQYMLVQMNWEGHICKSYLLSGDILGQFCVDEKTNKVYFIKNSTNAKGEEIFSIVSYGMK